MPEAPVDEDGHARSREDDVRPDGAIARSDGVVLAIAQSQPVELAAQPRLWAGSLTAVATHPRRHRWARWDGIRQAVDERGLDALSIRRLLNAREKYDVVVSANPDLVAWLRALCSEYRYDAAAVFRREGSLAWPLHAVDAADLQRQLEAGGHFLPLPKEPASLANVLEVSFVRFLIERVEGEVGVAVRQGTERGYPDLELSGARFGGGFHAIDVKAARRKPLKRSRPTSTQSRITLYTGNTYFKWPQLRWPGMFRPFEDYESHLDVIFLYTLDERSLARATDIELLVHEPWRIASRKRSSTTREYIGAVTKLDRLRSGEGDFDSEQDFHSFWRAFKFRTPEALQSQVRKLIAQSQRQPLDPDRA